MTDDDVLFSQLVMERCTPVFQISGIKNRDKKRALLRGIHQLGGKYIGSSVSSYKHTQVFANQVGH